MMELNRRMDFQNSEEDPPYIKIKSPSIKLRADNALESNMRLFPYFVVSNFVCLL